MAYNFTTIEKKWQQYWLQHKSFRALDPQEASGMPKAYVLDMFPYPSGAGLHVGHPEGYTATDIVSRYLRMKQYNVLHPMGWDAFGLPAEQYAIKTGQHPRITTEQNIRNFRRQIQMLGLSYDWDREVDTTDPGYYKWTQWIFLQIFNSYFDPVKNKAVPIAHLLNELQNENYIIAPDGSIRLNRTTEALEVLSGPSGVERLWKDLSPDEQRDVIDGQRLAYTAEVPVNWCPALGTVLANEEVIDGRSEVGGFPVEKRPMRQWMLRITSYADRLLSDLDLLDWPESLKEMQRNWIGKSVGAEVDFEIDLGHRPPAPPGGFAQASEPQAHPLGATQSAHAGSSAPGSDAAWQSRSEVSAAAIRSGSEGFGVEGTEEPPIVTVFTTRPDTLYGATYMVLAPEHPLVDQITAPTHRETVEAYRTMVSAKSERDRMAETKEKTGVFTGAYAVNPVNREHIPIYIADYVLMGYGTGAIMAVPAHDERDFEFATKFGLPIRAVVQPEDTWLRTHAPAQQADKGLVNDLRNAYARDAGAFREAFTGNGVAINSGSLNGLATPEAKEKITSILDEAGTGHRSVNYKLRDWLFSRQRYWGEPFPIVLDDQNNAYALPEQELPLIAPELEDFKPTGTPEPPLSKARQWLRYERDGKVYTRETNTMPQWAGSCWYYLRYIDPHNEQRFVDPQKEKYWMPVDLYVGGVEHAVLHLLYSRFWHKVLFDLGHVSTPEPFQRLVNQGLILGEMEFNAFQPPDGSYISAAELQNIREEVLTEGPRLVGEHKQTRQTVVANRIDADLVEKKGDRYVLRANPAIVVDARAFKMSKSRGNVVNPDEIVRDYGADTFRLYEMYMGPLEAQKPWNTRDIVGMSRFLNGVWRNLVGDEEAGKTAKIEDTVIPDALDRTMHRTIRKVGDDIAALRFNTAIAELIKLNNEMNRLEAIPRKLAEDFTLMLAPFAPHLAEEIWHRLGHQQSLARHPWPKFDESKLVETTIEIPVQVNGKLRGKAQVPADASKEVVIDAARIAEGVPAWLGGKRIVKEIYVPGKLVNFVVA